MDALTGEFPAKHSEELKRGITIRIGYADCDLRKCPNDHWSTKEVCPCGKKTKLLRRISFIDCPGHETLMATMLAGSAVMDGALLVIAADEPCPQPQTREHLKGLEIAGVKRVVVVQNKVDLVSEKEALDNYEQIKEFLNGTFAKDSPILPVSALQKTNIDALVEVMYDYFPIPKRDLKSNPKMFIARSFDINRPGTEISKLKGGVLGGSLSKGIFKKGDELEIKPGYQESEWKPLRTTIVSLVTGGEFVDQVVPGGNIGVGTELDPSLTKADNLVGSVVGHPDKLPPILDKLEVEVNLLDRVVGAKEELEVEPLQEGELLMLNCGTATTIGWITKLGKKVEIKLKRPVCAESGDKVAIARRVKGRWRLIGHGSL